MREVTNGRALFWTAAIVYVCVAVIHWIVGRISVFSAMEATGWTYVFIALIAALYELLSPNWPILNWLDKPASFTQEN